MTKIVFIEGITGLEIVSGSKPEPKVPYLSVIRRGTEAHMYWHERPNCVTDSRRVADINIDGVRREDLVAAIIKAMESVNIPETRGPFQEPVSTVWFNEI